MCYCLLEGHTEEELWTIWKLKLSCTCSNSTSLSTPQPCNKARVKLPSVHTSPAHASYVVWQKSNETDFLLTMNFILFSNQGYPLQNSSFGNYTTTEALFPLFVALLEGFCWYTFQLVGYVHLDIIQSTKMAPFQVVFESGNKKKSQGLRSDE